MMKETIQQDIETLVKLQEAESEIVRLKAVLEKVEKEKHKIGLQVETFKAGLDKDQEELAIIQKGCRDVEAEIQLIDDRIVKSNEKLRMVKTNKEYQFLLREVDDNKKRKDTLETELIGEMEKNEALTAAIDETQKEYQLLKDKIEAEQGVIDEKTAHDKEKLDEYLKQQQEIGKRLSPELMTRFQKVSKMNNGSAVIQVKNGTCMGCFMSIPPQLFIEVQRGNSLISCPQCSRILFHENT